MAFVSIVRAVDGAAVAVRGRVLQQQPGVLVVVLGNGLGNGPNEGLGDGLADGLDVPATTPLLAIVHTEPPVVSLATASPMAEPNTYSIRLYERRS